MPPGGQGRRRARAARQTLRSASASLGDDGSLRRDARGLPGPQRLPRRLRRPRHGLRTIHRRHTLASVPTRDKGLGSTRSVTRDGGAGRRGARLPLAFPPPKGGARTAPPPALISEPPAPTPPPRPTLT